MSSDEDLVNLINNYLVNLPDEILIKILDLLTVDHIIDFFLYVPTIRDLLIRYYYSNEMHFMVVPTKLTYIPKFPWYKRRDFITLHGMEVFRFLQAFPEIVPKKLLIISGARGISTVREVLEHDITKQIDEIHITLERCEISPEDFQYLISFSNLTKVHFSGMDLNSILPALINNSNLSQHPKLEDVVFLRHDINDWSGVQFPLGLRSLDLSWNKSTDLDTLTIPPNIEQIYFNEANALNLTFSENKFGENLTTLMMTFNDLETIILEDLPRGLHTLDLSKNKITSIVGSKWPQDLKILLLNKNQLNDSALFNITWPRKLTNLGLSENQITCIDTLSNLPNTLEILVISVNPMIWRATTRKFTFPENLINLDISECHLADLKYVEFPVSLKKLILGANGITDLLTYRDWTSLFNLDTLDLFANEITSLNNWIIPSNLRKIDLQYNQLLELTSECPIFQSKYNSNLFELDVESCRIENIDLDYIPPSLKKVNLRQNRTLPSKFIFPGIFKQLHHINLCDNDISSLVFIEDNIKSQLRSLDLARNQILRGVASSGLGFVGINQFYLDLEANLGKVKNRKFNVNSLHEFVK
ncbi:hypothetical protein JA1_004201 [Spathaspora sp. JA1]|nr:hypothetical protein JA1_004201 [Spathaspora sp. JA1]